MQQWETGTQESAVKRVSVRTGGAGHAHSGVIKAPDSNNDNIADGGVVAVKSSNIVVRLGR